MHCRWVESRAEGLPRGFETRHRWEVILSHPHWHRHFSFIYILASFSHLFSHFICSPISGIFTYSALRHWCKYSLICWLFCSFSDPLCHHFCTHLVSKHTLSSCIMSGLVLGSGDEIYSPESRNSQWGRRWVHQRGEIIEQKSRWGRVRI